MGRQFFYGRVSKDDNQMTTENQRHAFEAMGYTVERFVTDECSGTIQALERSGFSNMLEHKLESGDELHILKIDRLGRDNIDVQNMVELILSKGVKLHIHDLPSPDLTKPEGKLMLQMFAVFAEFERNRIAERTRQGLARVKAEGKQLGRPSGSKHYDEIQRLKSDGHGQSAVAKMLNIGRSTVVRNWA
ncbi:recombinase family protein [Vibrio owensii]|uniref:recombinase family protein n=1 Tax=Vibrio owensii TaxID=696485 RepID=UPI00059722FA|nr:recombinase family protein [Vibrio owensii]